MRSSSANHNLLSVLVLLLASLLALSGCAATKIKVVWKDDVYQGHPKNVLVITVAGNVTVRREIESGFAKRLKERGAVATESFRVLPEGTVLSGDTGRDAVVAVIKELGIDAVLITRVTGRRSDVRDIPGMTITLISEEPIASELISNAARPGPLPEAVLAHLDLSHIAVHTYPESHPDNGISTFRADIDVSTCGRISPLKALNYLIHSFESDIVIMDYRVRGFTRDVDGRKHYIDHKINSIQNYITRATKERYQRIDVNVYQENIFHTKMMLREFDLDNYLFGVHSEDIPPREQRRITERVKREMVEIFNGKNIQKGMRLT